MRQFKIKAITALAVFAFIPVSYGRAECKNSGKVLHANTNPQTINISTASSPNNTSKATKR